MAVVVNWGGALDNTYIGLTEANSYIGVSLIDPSPWTGATTPQQEAALIQAARDIDARNFIGSRYFFEQALQFPRAVRQYAPDNLTVSSSLLSTPDQVRMKRDVEQATCYQAVFLLRNGGRNIHAENVLNGIKKWEETTGPIRDYVEYKEDASMAQSSLCAESIRLLMPWLTTRGVKRK